MNNMESETTINEAQEEEMTTLPYKMPLWMWIILFIAGTFILTMVYGLGSMWYEFNIPMWIESLLYIIGGLVMVYCYLGFEKWYCNWNRCQLSSKIKVPFALKDTGKGMLIGIGYFCIVVLVMALIGDYGIKSYQFDIKPLIGEFCLFFFVAVSEECIMRGVMFRLIDERWGYLAALIVSSLLFGIMHLPNDAGTLWGCIAIAIEAGLLLGAAYKMSGSLWLPIGIHWTWNFTQGDVFGFVVSGNTGMTPSIITPELRGSDLITGGAFGAEASVISVILGFAISCWMIYKIHLTANANSKQIPFQTSLETN